MPDAHSEYPVSVAWEGGRLGRAFSADGLPDLRFAPPPSFGGPAGFWSPEHLFVLSAASCWLTTFLAMATASKLELTTATCAATGTLVRDEDRRFRISAIVLRPRVTTAREEDRDLALRLVQRAEAACLIRNSMRTEITIDPEIHSIAFENGVSAPVQA